MSANSRAFEWARSLNHYQAQHVKTVRQRRESAAAKPGEPSWLGLETLEPRVLLSAAVDLQPGMAEYLAINGDLDDAVVVGPDGAAPAGDELAAEAFTLVGPTGGLIYASRGNAGRDRWVQPGGRV